MHDIFREITNSIQCRLLCVALVLALITGSQCTKDDYCEPDPLYGGCSSSCEYNITPWSVLGKTMGFGVVLTIGVMLGESHLKRKLESDVKRAFSDYENSSYYKEKTDKKELLSAIKSTITYIITRPRD